MEARLDALELRAARLLALSLPAAFRPPRQGHSRPHVAIVLDGALEETRGRRTAGFAAGDVRIAALVDPHDLETGRDGARCLVVELASGIPWTANAARRTPDPRLTELARGVAALLPARQPALRVRAERLGHEIAARARRLGRGLDGRATPAWLDELGNALARQPGRHRGLAALGRSAGVHPVHVARAFRDHYGCSIGAWLRLHRLERACTLLAHRAEAGDPTRLASLADISDEAGFADQAHLTRCLRQALGTTPAQLRRAAV